MHILKIVITPTITVIVPLSIITSNKHATQKNQKKIYSMRMGTRHTHHESRFDRGPQAFLFIYSENDKGKQTSKKDQCE